MKSDESKIIFFTGAPGSKWSAVSHILGFNNLCPINKSDYREDRFYEHPYPNPPMAHQGAYWGPGFGLGENFHNISQLTKEEILSQIDEAYTDKSWEKYRIVKCHQFANNLEWIKENFPKSKILIVYRTEKYSVTDWQRSGWNITYPNYVPYYKNDDILAREVIRECQAAKKFIHKYDLKVDVALPRYWRERWNVEKSTEELKFYIETLVGPDLLVDPITNKVYPEPKKWWQCDILIAEYNF